MTQPLDHDPPEEMSFQEYVEYLRKQPPHAGFPRKTFEELCIERGVGPIDKAEISAGQKNVWTIYCAHHAD